MRYQSKVDKWLVVLLAGAVALPVAFGVVSYARAGFTPATWLPLAIAFLIAGVICLVAVPTWYELKPDKLVIRSGVLHWEVRLNEIVSISSTSNPLSSPAWSLKRLEITWRRAGGDRSISISPQQTEEFLRDVTVRDPDLVFADGGLQRSR